MQRACAEWQVQQQQQQAVVPPSYSRFVAISGQQVVVEVPTECVLPLLQHCSRVVNQELCAALGPFAGHSSDHNSSSSGEAETAAAGGDGEGPVCRLPFRWWWGSGLDVLKANHL